MAEDSEINIEYRWAIASPQHRLGGRAVDVAMYVVTLGIGWVIWSLVVWGQGQTPGKQIVKLRVYDKRTRNPVKWGHMAIRELLVPLAVSLAMIPLIFVSSVVQNTTISYIALVVSYLSFFIWQLVDAIWIFKGEKRNRLVDLICKTDVLNETN